MKQLLLILFVLNLLQASAQRIDSLQALATALPHDSDRVMLFYREGFANRATNPQYSYDCALQAQQYAQHASLPYYAAKAANLLGILYYRKGDLGTAMAHHKKALALRLLVNDKPGMAISQTNLGNVFTDLKLYTLAEEAYLKALEINLALGQPAQAGKCLLNLGALFTELKNTTLAQNYYNQALANAQKRFDYELQASCYNNLAVLSTMEQNFDAAIGHALNSIKIKNLMDNEMEMADSYLNLSNAFFYKNDLAQGLAYLNMADSIIAKYNYLPAKLQALLKHADYEARDKNFEAAFGSLKRYHFLKDSLAVANAEATANASFSDLPAVQEDVAAQPSHHFPTIYFAALLIVCVGGAALIIKNT